MSEVHHILHVQAISLEGLEVVRSVVYTERDAGIAASRDIRLKIDDGGCDNTGAVGRCRHLDIRLNEPVLSDDGGIEEFLFQPQPFDAVLKGFVHTAAQREIIEPFRFHQIDLGFQFLTFDIALLLTRLHLPADIQLTGGKEFIGAGSLDLKSDHVIIRLDRIAVGDAAPGTVRHPVGDRLCSVRLACHGSVGEVQICTGDFSGPLAAHAVGKTIEAGLHKPYRRAVKGQVFLEFHQGRLSTLIGKHDLHHFVFQGIEGLAAATGLHQASGGGDGKVGRRICRDHRGLCRSVFPGWRDPGQ